MDNHMKKSIAQMLTAINYNIDILIIILFLSPRQDIDEILLMLELNTNQ